MWLCGVLAFVPFFTLAYRNLLALHTELPALTGRWRLPNVLIPVLCLLRPKRVAAAIWRAGADERPPALLTAWWATWVVTNWIIPPADHLSAEATTVRAAQFATDLEIVAEITAITAAVLLIQVTRSIAERQAAAAALTPESRRAPAESGRSPLASRT